MEVLLCDVCGVVCEMHCVVVSAVCVCARTCGASAFTMAYLLCTNLRQYCIEKPTGGNYLGKGGVL